MGEGEGVREWECSLPNKNEWYKFDDSSITLVKPEDYDYDIIPRNAYLVFTLNNIGTAVSYILHLFN